MCIRDRSVHSGPMCTGMTVNHEGKAVLSFEAGTDKLWAVDELKGFAIAGDRKGLSVEKS